MFVCDNAHDIATRYYLPYLPWLCNTISIFVAPPKVAKARTMVTVACHSRWRYHHKNIANVNMA